MLNKKSKIVLKTLHKINFKYENIDAFCVLLPKMSKDDIEQTLWYLEETGYISCSPTEDTIWWLEPTYRGEQYKEFKIVELKEFIFKSILVPIFVSVVVSCITVLISLFLT